MDSDRMINCRCPHHLVIPALISLIGIVLFLGNLELLSTSATGLLWPIFLTLIGFQKMFSHRCKCCVDHHHCHHTEGGEQK